MASTFSWLDYSEAERRKVLDVVHSFADRETRDELGIGTVRDSFANKFFPGTSTIQTRARYFLFVPWIYAFVERRLRRSGQVSASDVASLARTEEVRLIDILAESEDPDGTIGIEARSSLKRLPSNIYWQGLEKWGIKRIPGSQDLYHRALSKHGPPSNSNLTTDDQEPVGDRKFPNWHQGIPKPPEGFPKGVSFKLEKSEAEYLRERLMSYAKNTLLSFLVDEGLPTERVDFPWMHPQVGELPARIREQLDHARNFSESIHGAAILYNLMLARLSESHERVEEYEGKYVEWADWIEENLGVFNRWDRHRFWEIVEEGNDRIPGSTKTFINEWLELVFSLGDIDGLVGNTRAHVLIRDRERFLKKGQARLENRRALELWAGASGTNPLDFRWGVVQTILGDIQAGIGVGDHNA